MVRAFRAQRLSHTDAGNPVFGQAVGHFVAVVALSKARPTVPVRRSSRPKTSTVSRSPDPSARSKNTPVLPWLP